MRPGLSSRAMANLDVEADLGTVGGSYEGSVADFFALMKPRVMSLVVFTALTGMVAAPGGIHPVIAIIALLAIAIGAGASGALNMWYDADIDARMARTAARPIPRGKVTADEALTFGAVLSVFSVLTLGVLVNWVAGALLAFTIGFYLFVYTMWLKRSTPQNIVIGGAAGALPPVIGWAAVTGSVGIPALLLFALVFYWTPPHFWALSLRIRKDYAAAGVPMLPVVKGIPETTRQIALYTVLMVAISLMLWAVARMGAIYLGAALILGAIFLWQAYGLWRRGASEEASTAGAIRLYKYSISYLSLLFLAVAIDALVLIPV